ncbi:hypothetical protein T10_6715 [Trichinella papuae]|uniref:Uncharacterized protein n=1 Tax=Trichinella papuae TaxID=268474 RepID=A0A0V1MP53_9BILA|nr:hypothetical protein T10_6715 [Trichinella papuae]
MKECSKLIKIPCITCRVLLLAEFPHFLPAVLAARSPSRQIFTAFYVATIEETIPCIGIERVLGITRQIHDETQVINLYSGTWPHDGIDQALDVDGRRANCCIPSIPVTNRWAIARFSCGSEELEPC